MNESDKKKLRRRRTGKREKEKEKTTGHIAIILGIERARLAFTTTTHPRDWPFVGDMRGGAFFPALLGGRPRAFCAVAVAAADDDDDNEADEAEAAVRPRLAVATLLAYTVVHISIAWEHEAT